MKQLVLTKATGCASFTWRVARAFAARRLPIAPLGALALAACGDSAEPATDITTGGEALSGCSGKASSSTPASGRFYLTSFGGPGEGQTMSCGQSTRNGTWYYAASRQRYGCGAHVAVEANGKCVVVATDDYGPDLCVERRAGGPILDASPLVSQYLFGERGAGWSDRRAITVTRVSNSTPLGPCGSSDSDSDSDSDPDSPTDAEDPSGGSP
jgi:hypothetical protein